MQGRAAAKQSTLGRKPACLRSLVFGAGAWPQSEIWYRYRTSDSGLAVVMETLRAPSAAQAANPNAREQHIWVCASRVQTRRGMFHPPTRNPHRTWVLAVLVVPEKTLQHPSIQKNSVWRFLYRRFVPASIGKMQLQAYLPQGMHLENHCTPR